MKLIYKFWLKENITPILGDVSQRADTEAIINHALNHFGRLDILVNAAGITSRTVRPEADFAEKWEAVMQVNAKGTMMM